MHAGHHFCRNVEYLQPMIKTTEMLLDGQHAGQPVAFAKMAAAIRVCSDEDACTLQDVQGMLCKKFDSVGYAQGKQVVKLFIHIYFFIAEIRVRWKV